MVSAIDAELVAGDFICLIGRNGTGKSTLLKTIAGLIPPLNGICRIEENAAQADNGGISELKKNANQVSIVLTQIPDLPNTTVFELVSYGRLPYMNLFAKLKEEDVKATEEAIKAVGIEFLSHKKLNNLSDGEKQKAMIARALAQGSSIILLDEPSAFLDYPSKHELMQLLKDLAHNHGKAILLSSHDLDIVKKYADKIWEIENNRLHIR